MSWTEVTSSRASGGGSTGDTSITATFGATIPSGALMWGGVVYEGGASGYITGMSGGGTWSMATSEVQIPGPDVWLSAWKCVSTSAAAHTVTVSLSASRLTRGLFIGAFTGNGASGTVNDALGEYDAATSAPSVSLTTTVNGCLIIGLSINNNGVGATAGSGFSTVVTGGVDYLIAFEWKEQATAGSVVADFTSLSGTPGFSIHGVAFEPSTITTYQNAGTDGMKIGESLSYNVVLSPSTCRIVSTL